MIKFKNETPIRTKHIIIAAISIVVIVIFFRQESKIDSLKNSLLVCNQSHDSTVETYNSILEHYLTSEQLTDLRKKSNQE